MNDVDIEFGTAVTIGERRYLVKSISGVAWREGKSIVTVRMVESNDETLAIARCCDDDDAETLASLFVGPRCAPTALMHDGDFHELTRHPCLIEPSKVYEVGA